MSVSINDIHEDLISKLESAVDMGKFLSVFNTLVGVIKDQQVKIDELDARAINAEKLAAEAFETAKRKPSISTIPSTAADAGSNETNELIIQLQDKIDGLEDKLNNTLLELHGMGEDNSILDREEQPPEVIIKFVETKSRNPIRFPLPAQKKFTSDSPSIKESRDLDEEVSSPVGFSPVSSPPTSSRRPSVPQVEQQPTEAAAATSTVAAEEPQKEESKEQTGSAEERSKASTPIPEAIEEARLDAASKDPSRAPTPAMLEQQPQAGSPPTVPTDPSEEAVVSVASIVPATASFTNSDPGVSAAVTAAAALVNAHHHHQQRLTQHSNGGTPRQESTDNISPLPTPGSQHSRAQSIAFRSGLLTVTPLEQRPSAMRESFSTKLAQVEAQLFPVRDELLTKSQKDMKVANALWKASVASGMNVDETFSKQHPHLHRRIIPHYYKYHLDSDLPYERRVALAEYRDIRKHDRKECMDANNLTLLSPERRAKLVRQLKQKGRFIQISRNMLEDSRQKYASRSLKQNVEFVEAETRRLFNRVNQLRDALKRQYNTTRYLLPVDFYETFDRLVDFLEHMELKGGVEEIMALPRSDTIMCFGLDGSMPSALVDMVNEQIKPLVSQELVDLKNQIKKLQEESLTHVELAELMMPESSTAEVGAGVKVVRSDSKSKARVSDPFLREKELARKRTISLIRECIAEDRKAFEMAKLKQEADEACIKEHENSHQATVSTIIHTHTPVVPAPVVTQPRPKTPSMIILQQADTANIANKLYVDERITSLEEQLLELRLALDNSKDTSVNDMAFLRAKLEKVEAANAVMMEHDTEAREQRRKDAEALKIMQKRLANVSVDNVMDELKVLQLQVNDRPSTSDVGNMMEGISMTFRKHLGENVVGLRSLVDQVYRQIHRKVNREDIKKLISAKLSQMEHEILKREEEMFSAASSTRCMSCGQLPPDPTNAFVNHTAARKALQSGGGRDSNHYPHSAGGVKGANTGTMLSSDHNHSVSTTRSIQLPTTTVGSAGFLKAASRPNTSPTIRNNSEEFTSMYPNDPSSASLMFHLPTDTAEGTMDDEISLHSERSIQAAGTSPVLGGPAHAVLGPVRSEEVYSVLTGSAGLKSLMPQHTPMIPIRDPYGNTLNNTTGQQKPLKKVEKIPEPMYRKAKMAAHLKEMVKVTAPSAQTYGYTANNPFFVMEGYSTEEIDPFNGSLEGSSLYSTSRNTGAGGSRPRPRTQSGSNSTMQQQQGGQQVYVPIPRNSSHAHASSTQLMLSASQNMVGECMGGSSSNVVTTVNTILPAISNKTPR